MGGAAERRLGDFLLGVAAAGAVALSAAISLGFGAFAVYAYLQASQGRVVAALIVCAAFGATAITIWAVAMAPPPVAPRRDGVRVGVRRGSQFNSTAFGHGWRPTGPTGRGDAAGTRAFADAAFRAGARWRIHRGKKTREVSRFRIEATLANQAAKSDREQSAALLGGARMAPSDARFCAGASEATRTAITNAAPLSSCLLPSAEVRR